ncbi:Hypothetical predicted protein [Podarcis lilfordi]|uniref:Uncharacterized protein n=1 Tax=Podarcis lilfordi TaxID=74358 RepID=A0AA35P401_9SAUR|nr:Hypothetical predicted protein [Podarcis lilfordi]
MLKEFGSVQGAFALYANLLKKQNSGGELCSFCHNNRLMSPRNNGVSRIRGTPHWHNTDTYVFIFHYGLLLRRGRTLVKESSPDRHRLRHSRISTARLSTMPICQQWEKARTFL